MKPVTFAAGFVTGAWVGVMVAVAVIGYDAYRAWRRHERQEQVHAIIEATNAALPFDAWIS